MTDELAPGTVLDDKFRVVSLLGRGGMGAVYEITHELTHHQRAMKLLHPQHAARKEAVNRFLREASAAGRIGNPHIVETFDAGWLTSGEPYLVMEMLEGQSLADRLDEVDGVGLPVAEATRVLSQVCDGVHAAHEAGIIHRDLKPENIFLCPGDGGWFVKLLDFGVSKFDQTMHTVSSHHTADGAFVGTPAYMSPEQFEDGAAIDERSDVYALGVILYEMLAGVHPYPAKTLAQLARKMISVTVPPITDARPDAPAELDGLLERALRKHPDERTITAEVMGEQLAALGRVANADPVAATVSIESPASEPAASIDETGDAPIARSIAATSRPAPTTIEPKPSPFPWVAAAVVLVVIASIALQDRTSETTAATVMSAPKTANAPTPTVSAAPSVTASASASASVFAPPPPPARPPPLQVPPRVKPSGDLITDYPPSE